MDTPSVYLDYLRLSVDGQLVMGAGLQYDFAREYHNTTNDHVIGRPMSFPNINFAAGKCEPHSYMLAGTAETKA